MFIATKQNQYLLAPQGAKPRNSARNHLGCRAPTEHWLLFGQRQAINISPYGAKQQNCLFHFQIEFAKYQRGV